MPSLVCKNVRFYSPTDEFMFFDWISRIKAIHKVEDVGDELHLHIQRTSISDISLRDLLALFYRYKIDMKQLSQFLSPKNREWFTNNRSYWYKLVFEEYAEHENVG